MLRWQPCVRGMGAPTRPGRLKRYVGQLRLSKEPRPSLLQSPDRFVREIAGEGIDRTVQPGNRANSLDCLRRKVDRPSSRPFHVSAVSLRPGNSEEGEFRLEVAPVPLSAGGVEAMLRRDHGG